MVPYTILMYICFFLLLAGVVIGRLFDTNNTLLNMDLALEELTSFSIQPNFTPNIVVTKH